MAFRTGLACAGLATCSLLGTAPAGACEINASPWAGPWAEAALGRAVREGVASAATVSVVQDNRIVLLKGYGVADRPGGRRVDPCVDRFQLASVSKTFSAAVLGQFLDEGRVRSLDDPVDAYLRRARLPQRDGGPVTFRGLVTHSAGFEERVWGYYDRRRFSTPLPGADLRRALPRQVRPAGRRSVYANADAAVLGAVLEDVAGRPLSSVLQAQLFGPLGMTRSALNDSGGRRPGLVVPLADGAPLAGGFASPYNAPMGGVEATGLDMAAYLEAMLGERPKVLSPTAVTRLTSPQFRNDPALEPLGMFWFLSRWGQTRIVEHSGGLPGVGAWVILIPERRIGVFIAWAGGARMMGPMGLHDGVLGAALGPPQARPTVREQNLGQYAGRYLDERRPQSTAEAVLFLESAVETVSAGPDGLVVGDRGPYRPVGRATFVRAAGPGRQGETIVFRDGRLMRQAGAAERISGLSDPRNQTLMAALGFMGAVSGVLGLSLWPDRRLGALGVASGLAAGATAAVLLGWRGGDLNAAAQSGEALQFRLAALGVAILLAMGLGLAAGLAARAPGLLAARRPPPPWLVHASVVCAGALILAAVLISWGLLLVPGP